MNLRHATNMDKASEKNESQWRSVILQKDTNRVSEKTTSSKFTADVRNHEE